MKIANGIDMLELTAEMMGKVQTIYPVLLKDEKESILIDTGFPGQLPLIKKAFEKAEVPIEKLTKIIITHQDIDHIGSLPALLNQSETKIEVLSSDGEKPYIEGEKQILKITPEAIAHVEANLPPELPEEWKKAFVSTLNNPPKAPVDRTIENKERLPYCGGIVVLDTPGHTPAHISLYHEASRTLIAGDALIVENGVLQGPSPSATLDLVTAVTSLKPLLEFDIERVICYHGGLFEGDVHNRIKEIIGA